MVPLAPTMTSSPSLLDRLGLTASLACAAHCALMPLLVSALPLFLQDERLEWALVGSSAGLGISSLVRGYRRHQRRLALVVLALGLLLLVLGRLTEEAGGQGYRGVVLVVLGGLGVALAHFLNHHLSCPRS
ncbi:MerC domain-containing protein [Armatimonas rosea]|uniref:Multisubunit Na+/H+ antiporter MnhB subunit n=1 Tax=Armatimonas rosea TaxID=685828 RepID=A0A7W9W6M5_ARMRO|nr:MerC domain-containing protein [Armatimonas rosea]MBB6050205.1 multisubunit Na+/H+ antiporter MnhB subunit [Armatimonas rosea]